MNSPECNENDRRPIASRDTAVAKRVANWLAARGASPNGISVAGMVAALFGGLAFYSTSIEGVPLRAAWLTGAVMAQLRLLANMFDGMVAIERGIASPVGELYNEVPDRVSDTAILVGLGYSAGGFPAAGWSAALIAIFTAYVRAMAKVAGAPHDFCGPMAKPQRMALLTGTCLLSALLPTSWQWTHAESGIGLAGAALLVIVIGGLITSIRRLREIGRKMRAAAATGDPADV